VEPVYKRVDTCAAEFESFTPYLYSTYEEEDEATPTKKKKVIILGSGPNRIGQGIEFDYCCCHAAFALRDDGYETIMVNCNPETVSTDYDTSDRLYFEPLTLEDVLEIVHIEKPLGVIVQYGGQTPLKLARDLEKNGVPIIGTTPDMIDMAEDRERFQQMLHRLKLRQPPNRTARTEAEACDGPRPQRRRPDERTVRDSVSERPRRPGSGVCAGSQSARVADGALRLQGDGQGAGQDRPALHGRSDAGQPGYHRRSRAPVFLGQGGGVSVHQVSRCRHDSGTGDEVDRRGYGRGRYLCRGVP